MKFFCDKNEIAAMLSQVIKIVAAKSSISLYEGIYIEAKGESCKIIGSNGQITIEGYFKADIKEEGYALVPGRTFYDIIRYCYEGDVEITIDKQIDIVSDKFHTSFSIMDADNYPMVNTGESKWSFEMTNEAFKNAVRGSIFCAASENYNNPELTGVYIEKDMNDISFVAIDGCRVAIRKNEAFGELSGKILVPAKALDEITKTMGDGGNIKISVYEKHIEAEIDNLCIFSTIFDVNNYVKFNDIIPNGYETRILVEKTKLLTLIERGTILSRSKQNNLLILNIADECLAISAKSELGELFDEVSVWSEGEPLKIGFNGSFLLDCLKNIADEFVYIEFNKERNPCVIKPKEGNEFLYMILPIQI